MSDSDSSSSSSSSLCEYDRIRLANVAEKQALLADMFKAKEDIKPKKKMMKRETKKDKSIPTLRRRSSRIALQSPVSVPLASLSKPILMLSHANLSVGDVVSVADAIVPIPMITETKEEVNRKKKKEKIKVVADSPSGTPGKPPRKSTRSFFGRNQSPPTLDPGEVTEEMLSSVADKAGQKRADKYSGTTCHQCRQKTDDTKSVCRSGRCVGLRGQFCGVCLLNRYGERVREALLDPKWSCPSCRDVCNCSICQNRKGSAPTGIVSPVAKANGFNSVKEYLESNPITVAGDTVKKALIYSAKV